MPSRARLARDYAALSAGELLSKLAGFAAFAYLARVLAPEHYGAVELAVAVTMVASLIVDFGLGPVASRAITERPERATELLASVSALRLLLALLAVAAVAAVGRLVAEPGPPRQLLTLVALGLLFAPWTLNWLFQGLERIPWVAPAQLLRMGAFAAGALLFVRGPDQLLRVGWIEVAAAALMAAYFAVAAHYHGSTAPPRFRRESMASLAREALPIGGSQLLWSLNLYLPTLALAGWLGSQSVGYYGAAHRIVFALGSFVWLYFFNLFPVLVRTTRDPGAFRSLTAHSFRLAAWAGTLVAVTLSLLATPIAELAFGTAFAAAGRPLAMLVWVLPVTLLSGHARFALIASGNQTLEMLAQGGGVLATLLLAALLIPAWGPSGAALSVLGSAVVVWGLAQRGARAVGLVVPGPRRLVGPAFAACAALAAARLLPALLPAAASPLLAAALAAMLLLGAAAALEPQLRADGRRLLALGDAAGAAGSGEQGSGRSAPGE